MSESFSDKVSDFVTSDDDKDNGKHVATRDDSSDTTKHDSVEVIENENPANTGYVPLDERDKSEYDENRDGANDGERREVTREFVIAAHLDPMRQRDPNGIYLDDQRRRQAEVVRARVENREPDFDNMGTTAGDTVFDIQTARANAKAEAVVVADMELPVVVGDYERDAKGDAVTDEDDDD